VEQDEIRPAPEPESSCCVFMPLKVSKDSYINIMGQYYPAYKAVHDTHFGLNRETSAVMLELHSFLMVGRSTKARRRVCD
jgi:uncharacterized Fe-S radical SAM superfamily protein PflX